MIVYFLFALVVSIIGVTLYVYYSGKQSKKFTKVIEYNKNLFKSISKNDINRLSKFIVTKINRN